MSADDWHSLKWPPLFLLHLTPFCCETREDLMLACNNYLWISPSLWSSLHYMNSSGCLLFCFSVSPPSLSPRLISLHPIFCMRVESSDSVQTRVLLRRLQHHLPLRGERGDPRCPPHRWWHRHHRPNGEILVSCCTTLISTSTFTILVFLQLNCPADIQLILSSDRAGRVLPGAFPRCTLKGICAQPLCVVPLQGAWELPVWLLRGSVSHQYGQVKHRTAATQLPVRL